ncbi:DUF2530 domain-containing protein [Rhodoluna limnophila]|uniref:DUF2530 domain-containing protein n=1 Tax=Rhodoluna limnophila TaxID=232537 RepID=UPI0011069B70
MRFYVKDTERKPDPAPVKTNARLVIAVGVVLWAVALVLGLIFSATLASAQKSWWLSTCLFGIALGVFAFFKVRNR